MRKITVSGQNGYEILIEKGILSSCGEHIKSVTNAARVLIISDSNVYPVYGNLVEGSLKEAGFKVFSHIFPAGETSKTMDTVSGMIEALATNELSRNDLVVALGGGVTGDMAGFASAIYLRGISFVQIPTTLLSQVDSSVGGKTGCDLSFGKNLVGAFHNPALVLIDPNTISTLPERYKKDGIGEVIKYAFIKSEKLFDTLSSSDNFDDILEEVIYRCVDIKREVVENDFTEKGERMLLNFGHTLAHAIEKAQNYKGLAHGEAVGVGMLVEVTGTAAFYAGMQEIKQGTVKIIDYSYYAYEPVDITKLFANNEDLKNYVGLPVTIKDVAIGGQNLGGNTDYLYFELNGRTSYIRTYVTYFPTSLMQDDKAIIDAMHAEHFGWKANVTGLLVLYNNDPYLIPMGVDCFEYLDMIEKTPEEKVKEALNEFTIPERVHNNITIVLPEASLLYPDVTFVWESNNQDYPVVDNKVIFTVSSTPVDVVLTLTAT